MGVFVSGKRLERFMFDKSFCVLGKMNTLARVWVHIWLGDGIDEENSLIHLFFFHINKCIYVYCFDVVGVRVCVCYLCRMHRRQSELCESILLIYTIFSHCVSFHRGNALFHLSSSFSAFASVVSTVIYTVLLNRYRNSRDRRARMLTMYSNANMLKRIKEQQYFA